MPVRFQLVIDCADPDRLARFWAAALGYELAPVPAGFATWNDFYRQLGVPRRSWSAGRTGSVCTFWQVFAAGGGHERGGGGVV